MCTTCEPVAVQPDAAKLLSITPDCTLTMTYRESLQQVKETRTMFSGRYNIFSLCILDVKICQVPPRVTGGQLVKRISWVQIWLSLKSVVLLLFKPRVKLEFRLIY